MSVAVARQRCLPSMMMVCILVSLGLFKCDVHDSVTIQQMMLADYQHRRLVKYYKRLGFHSVLEVGNNGLSDLPHLLVWGGAGTRMNCIPEQFLQQWSPTLRRSSMLAFCTANGISDRRAS